MIDEEFRRYKRALEIVKAYHDKMKQLVKEGEDLIKDMSVFYNVTGSDFFMNTHMSVRLFNILILIFKEKKGDTMICELNTLSVKNFLSRRNAGPSLLKELMELCYCAGIKMKP